MSSQLKKYTVISEGPVTIDGAMRRKGDTVSLTDKQAKSYAGRVKRARPSRPEPGAENKTKVKS